jgi:tetratricopeptide (TPR) repeat protein
MLDNFSFEDFKRQLKENDKLRLTTYGLGALIVLSLGYFTYRQFIWGPSNEKSKDAYWSGLNYAAKDSTDKAISILEPAVKNYDGKQGGELAQFVLARQYMAKGDFTKALDELDGVNVEDTYLSIYRIGLQGDCKSELKKYDEALELYIEAAELNENEKTSPEYLFKAGLVAEKLNDFERASELYTRIKSNYLTFSNSKAIDKYIARTKNKTVK